MIEPNLPPRVTIVPVTSIQQSCSLIWFTVTMKKAVLVPGGDMPAAAK